MFGTAEHATCDEVKQLAAAREPLIKYVRRQFALGLHLCKFLSCTRSSCVFIDEADQSLGRRDASSGDSGVSGRIYSMLAEEMGNSNRGSVIWILASSRPDLIEVDLKRPGRVDVEIPLFPTSTKREGFDLLRMLLKKRGIDLPGDSFMGLEPFVPLHLTPGAAEAVAVKIYRLVRTSSMKLDDVMLSSLREYQNPVASDVMKFQIRLAVGEASDLEFVPALFRSAATPAL